MTSQNKPYAKFLSDDCVPVTSAFLALVSILHASRTIFINEKILAEAIGDPVPDDYMTRCEHVLNKVHGKAAGKIGLSLNKITFKSLMHLTVPEECYKMDYDSLQKTFYFDPWAFQGRGGILRFA